MSKRVIYSVLITFIIIASLFTVFAAPNFDLNGDGSVTVADISSLAQLYRGKGTYNASYDFDNDTDIDLFDLVRLARNVSVGAEPFFEDGFEAYSNGSQIGGEGGDEFGWGVPSAEVLVSDGESYSGSQSLQFEFYGSTWSRQPFYLTDDNESAPTEIWVEYMFRIPDNWIIENNEDRFPNNKFFAIWSEEYNDFDTELHVVFEFQPPGGAPDPSTEAELRLASALAEGYEERDESDVQTWNNIITTADRGEWVRIRIHLRSEVDNSAINVWKDDSLILTLNVDDYSIVAPGWDLDYFRVGYLMGSDNQGYAEPTYYYIDDFKVYSQDPGW